MKKIFIGCGIVVLLLLGAIAFVTWRLWPDIRVLRENAEAAVSSLNALAVAHPFDPATPRDTLDTERFAQALDVRARLCDDLFELDRELRELHRGLDEGDSDVGMFDAMARLMRSSADVYTRFAARLGEAQMSWPEYAWNVRLFWAVLARVDRGAGEPELQPLRGSYARLEKGWELVKGPYDWPALRDLLGDFPPPVVTQAASVMASDLPRVREGLRTISLEAAYMQPVTSTDKLGFEPVPEPEAAAEPPAPEPAPAPR